MKKLTDKEFIKKAKKIHKDKYDYSEVNYKGGRKKIIIFCEIHGKFEQKPHDHLLGKGCQKCGKILASNKERKTTKKFIMEAKEKHGERYNYSKTEYVGAFQNIIIICKKHGEFEKSPVNHLNGQGCKKCKIEEIRKKLTKTTKYFIEKAIKIHGDKYDYSKVKYDNAHKKVTIICKKHGEFKQVPNSHLQEIGCPHCANKNEGQVKNLLLKYFKGWKIILHKRIWEKYKYYNHRRYCDFWLEKNGIKIIVEYDGELHFKPVCFNGISPKKAEKEFKNYQLKDKLDKEFCEENNILLHRIKYNEDKEQSIKKLLRKISLVGAK